MMEASLIILLPDTWVPKVCSHRNTAIHFHQCVPYGEHGGRSLIELGEDEAEARTIVDEIRKHPSVERVEISRTECGTISATVVNRSCKASRVLASSDCFLVSAQSVKEGRVRWRLVTGREGSLNSLVQELRRSGAEVEVERVRSLGDKQILTKRQKEVLEIALREGYYETPKRIYLAGLSEMLGVSPSTLGETLKRAERLVIEDYLNRR